MTKLAVLSLLFASTSMVLVAGQGTQFITGACTSDADCASSCCGFNSGKCAGPVIAQTRDGGCGFGDAQSNDIAAQAFQAGQPAAPAAEGAAPAPAPAPAPAAGGDAAAGGSGTQFITGTCASDADCASACCGFNTGKCAGAVIAQERDGGCGFGDAQSNDDAAQAFQRRWLEAHEARGAPRGRRSSRR